MYMKYLILLYDHGFPTHCTLYVMTGIFLITYFVIIRNMSMGNTPPRGFLPQHRRGLLPHHGFYESYDH